MTTFGYDDVGNQTSLTDAEGVVTRYGYDELNRLDAVVENFNASLPSDHQTNVITEYRYDDLGLLHRVTDAKGSVWTYNYNALSQLIRNSDPLGNLWEYDYDAAGNLTHRTDARGFTTIFNFDALNRLRGIDYPSPDPDVTFNLDSLGNLVSMLDDLGTTTWNYDGLYRPDSITDPFGGIVGYAYDAVGNRVGLTYADAKSVTYEYDAAQRLESVDDWNSGTTTYSWDANGNLLSDGDGTFTYDHSDPAYCRQQSAISLQLRLRWPGEPLPANAGRRYHDLLPRLVCGVDTGALRWERNLSLRHGSNRD